MTNALGLDLSKYNAPSRQNLTDWRSLGYCIGIINVAIGTVRDLSQYTHRDNLLSAGYLTAPYLALHEAVQPEAQAQLLITLRSEFDIHLNAIDLERPALTDQMILRFMAEYDKLTKDELRVYTSTNRWNGYFKSRAGSDFAAKGRSLWIAVYPNDRSDYDKNGVWQGQLMDAASVKRRSNPPANYVVDIPDSWQKWDVHQFTGHGRLPGYEKDLDLSVYAMTEVELRQKYAPQTLPAPVSESELEVIHLFVPNNLSDDTMREVTEHLDALAKDVTARGKVYPYGPVVEVSWWEKLPSGAFPTSIKLRAANPCVLYSAQNGQIQRTITDKRVLDVYERQGEWLRVTTITAPIWVKASQVTTL